MDRKIASLLSLSARAAKLKTGETSAEKLLKNGDAKLVLIPEDASDNTKKKFVNKCFYYKKPIRIFSSKDEMSACIGKQNRTVYVVICDNFANRLISLIDDTSIEVQI